MLRTPQTLRWLLEQRQRRKAGHPETIHHVALELPTDSLWAAQLEGMACPSAACPRRFCSTAT